MLGKDLISLKGKFGIKIIEILRDIAKQGGDFTRYY